MLEGIPLLVKGRLGENKSLAVGSSTLTCTGRLDRSIQSSAAWHACSFEPLCKGCNTVKHKSIKKLLLSVAGQSEHHRPGLAGPQASLPTRPGNMIAMQGLWVRTSRVLGIHERVEPVSSVGPVTLMIPCTFSLLISCTADGTIRDGSNVTRWRYYTLNVHILLGLRAADSGS